MPTSHDPTGLQNGAVRALPGILAMVLIGAVIGACASGPKILVNEDPAATFQAYRTYGFASPLGTDRQEYSSLLSQHLKAAASREMEARGYQASDDPDLILNFYVETKEKIKSTSSPSSSAYMGGYYGYRGGYYGGWNGYETTVTQYTEGTLNVDVVDPERKQLVWEATVVGRIRDEARANLKATVDDVMAQVFDKYPHRAGASGLVPPP